MDTTKSTLDPNLLFAGVAEMPVSLDPEYERERRETEERQKQKSNQQELDDAWGLSFNTLKSLPLPFQIHLVFALITCSIIFIAFRYVATPSPSEAAPWWLVPWFFFGITCVGHYYFLSRAYWKGASFQFLLLTIGFYLINKTFTPEFDWYLFPIAIGVMVGMATYLYPRTSLIQIATYEFIIISGLCLVTWVNLQSLWTRFPWFVYPILTLGLALVIWYMWQVYKTRQWYFYSVVVGIDLTLQCLVTWAFITPSENTWPWWTIIFGFFAVLSLCLYIYVEGCFCCPLLEDSPNQSVTEIRDPENPQQEAPQEVPTLGGMLIKAAFGAILPKL